MCDDWADRCCVFFSLVGQYRRFAPYDTRFLFLFPFILVSYIVVWSDNEAQWERE